VTGEPWMSPGVVVDRAHGHGDGRVTKHRVALVEPLDSGSWRVRQWEVTSDLAGEVTALLPGDAPGSTTADGLAVMGSSQAAAGMVLRMRIPQRRCRCPAEKWLSRGSLRPQEVT
jgi:hypothetical protein